MFSTFFFCSIIFFLSWSWLSWWCTSIYKRMNLIQSARAQKTKWKWQFERNKKKKQILTAVKWGTQHITTQHNNNVKFSPSDQPFRFILLLIGVIIHVHCRFHAQRMYRFNLIVSVTLINCSVQLLRRVFVDKTEWLSDAHIGLNTQINCSNVEESCYSRNSPN